MGVEQSTPMRYHHSYCCFTYSIRWNKHAVLLASARKGRRHMQYARILVQRMDSRRIRILFAMHFRPALICDGFAVVADMSRMFEFVVWI